MSELFCAARGCRPGKTIQMAESEVRGLCLKSREIFLSQPILLELEAPLKICGMYLFYVGVIFKTRYPAYLEITKLDTWIYHIIVLFCRRHTRTVYGRVATI